MRKKMLLAASLKNCDRVFIVTPGAEDRTQLVINTVRRRLHAR